MGYDWSKGKSERAVEVEGERYRNPKLQVLTQEETVETLREYDNLLAKADAYCYCRTVEAKAELYEAVSSASKSREHIFTAWVKRVETD